MYNNKMVLLSLKPNFAESILDGIKQFEFRKVRIKEDVQHILLYASSPIKAFVGFIEIDKIIEGHPSTLWKVAGEAGGISRQQFHKYFKGRNNGYAIKIKAIHKFKASIDPKKLMECFHPPQSFRYINEGFLKDILEKENEKEGFNFLGWYSRGRKECFL